MVNMLNAQPVKALIWKLLPSPPRDIETQLERAGHAVAAHGHFLYVVAGRKGSKFYQDLVRLDTRKCIWEVLSNQLPLVPRANHSVTVIGDELWVIGGSNNKQVLGDVAVFNFTVMEWRLPKLRGPVHLLTRTAHASDVHPLNPKAILVFGGYGGVGTDLQWRNDTLIIHTDRLEVEALPQPSPGNVPSPRAYHSMNSINGRSYVMGGRDNVSVISGREFLWVFDPINNTWSCQGIVPSLDMCRSSHRVITLPGALLVYGGAQGVEGDPTTSQSRLGDLILFRLSNMSWTRLQAQSANGKDAFSCPVGRSAHSFTRVGNSAYVISGYAGAGADNKYASDCWELSLGEALIGDHTPATPSKVEVSSTLVRRGALVVATSVAATCEPIYLTDVETPGPEPRTEQKKTKPATSRRLDVSSALGKVTTADGKQAGSVHVGGGNEAEAAWRTNKRAKTSATVQAANPVQAAYERHRASTAAAAVLPPAATAAATTKDAYEPPPSPSLSLADLVDTRPRNTLLGTVTTSPLRSEIDLTRGQGLQAIKAAQMGTPQLQQQQREGKLGIGVLAMNGDLHSKQLNQLQQQQPQSRGLAVTDQGNLSPMRQNQNMQQQQLPQAQQQQHIEHYQQQQQQQQQRPQKEPQQQWQQQQQLQQQQQQPQREQQQQPQQHQQPQPQQQHNYQQQPQLQQQHHQQQQRPQQQHQQQQQHYNKDTIQQPQYTANRDTIQTGDLQREGTCNGHLCSNCKALAHGGGSEALPRLLPSPPMEVKIIREVVVDTVQVSLLEAEVAKLKSALEESRRSAAASSAEVRELESRTNAIRDELAATRQHLTSTLTDASHYKALAEERVAEVSSSRRLAEQHESMAKAAATAADEARAAAAAHATESAAHAATLRERTADVMRLESEVSALRVELSRERGEWDRVDTERRAAAEAMRQEAAETRAAQQEMAEAFGRLSKSLEAAQQQLTGCEAELAETRQSAREEQARLVSALQEAHATTERLQADLAESRAQCAAAHAESGQLRCQLEELRASHEEQKAHSLRTEAELGKLRAEVEVATAAYSQCREQRDALLADMGAMDNVIKLALTRGLSVPGPST